MRGKLTTAGNRMGTGGLIPAHAGKTAPRKALVISEKAHPRACGENVDLVFRDHGLDGSSPRMRGKPVKDFTVAAPVGLIPAHAGKTGRNNSRG